MSEKADASNGEINLAREPRFRVADVSVDPSSCLLTSGDQEIRLEPRVAQVLVALWRARGETLTRDDLVDQCWSGRTVSNDVVHRCIGALRKAAARFEQAPFIIETIPRVGYRLIETPSQNSADSRTDDEDLVHVASRIKVDRPLTKTSSRHTAIVPASLLVVLIAAILFFAFIQPVPLDEEPVVAPSLAVIPLANLSANTEHEPFVDGLTEELISKLGAVAGLRVPGRASSFQLKDKGLSTMKMAEQLNVRYVLEGAVQRDGDAVRITLQLTDAESGFQIWSNAYNRTVGTVLETQAAIAREVSLAIPSLISSSAESSLLTYVDPRALDFFLSGLGHLRARYFDSGWPEARAAFAKAVELDPDYAAANAYLAIAITELRPTGAEARAKEALAVAIRNAPGSAAVLFAEGWVAAAFGIGADDPDLDAAREFLDRSLLIDPTNSEALRARARIESDPKRKLELLRRVSEIDPLFYAGRLDLASELANQGRLEEAYNEFDKLYRIEPDRGVRGAIEIARAGTDMERLGKYAFATVGPSITTRPDRLLIAGLLADFGAIEEARYIYGHPTPDPLLFLPKRREVYLAWLDGDAMAASVAMSGADYSKIESSSVFGGAVALFADKPDEAIQLLLASYPDMPTWSDVRLGDLTALPEIIAAHTYGMALRLIGQADESRRVLLALAPAVVRLNRGELRAQQRYLGLAILYAQAGESGRAIAEFKKARAAGWRYPRTYAWINYAPSPPIDSPNGYLAPLRDDPEFQQMMDEIRTENFAALQRFERRFGTLSQLRAQIADERMPANGDR